MTNSWDWMPLDSARGKNDLAMRQLEQLERGVGEFLQVDNQRHELVREFEPETGYQVFRFASVGEMAPGWAALVGCVLHNLRSALDTVVWELVILNGAMPTTATQFPIYSSRRGFDSKGLGRLRGVEERWVRSIREMQPYRRKSPDEVPWLQTLARANNTDKHRTLHPSAALVTRPPRGRLRVSADREYTVVGERQQDYIGMQVEQAQVLAFRTDPVDVECRVHMEGDLPVQIAFGDVRPLTMNDLWSLTTHVGLFIAEVGQEAFGTN